MNYRKAFVVFLLLTITITFSQDKPGHNPPLYLAEYLRYDNIYHAAERFSSDPGYTEEKINAMNQEALDGFIKIMPVIEKAGDDSIAFHCWYKVGILQHYFDSLAQAQQSYQKAIKLKSHLPQLADSFLFKPYLFSGSIYYSMNLFDSALSGYKRAEQVASLYSSVLTGSNRLHNTLGALYYEMGNYRQAKNYFEKAIAVLPISDPYYKELLANYKINLASTHTKLEEFDEANAIYQSLLPLDINRNEILHNTGTIYLNLGAARKAISYFKQVKYSNNKQIRLLNDLGYAYLNIKMPDSAELYFREALKENQKWNAHRKNVPHGLTLKYLGDDQESNGNYPGAIEKYQQAIIQFSSGFNSPDIYTNPAQYSGVFSYINLFNTLTAKANAFEKLYQKEKNIKKLEAALDTYRSAFRLADYVEKTYDSDEARLFLNKIKYTAHSKPIDISLLLFDLTNKRNFLEDAYLFDQRNKGSILSLNIRENELRSKPGASNELFRQESAVKSAITRLSLKASQTTDSASLSHHNASIRDYEIQLGKLQEKINNDPVYGKKQVTERIPGINDLQKQLDSRTALLSYHLSGDRLLILFISSEEFEYDISLLSKDFFTQIDFFKRSLHVLSEDQKYNGVQSSMFLYQKLIAPVRSKLSQIDRLIIIPDDELNYLPFEALQDEKKQYLVQKFSIQYQYSTALFEKKHRTHIKKTALAFAPFISKSYTDSAGITFSSLPASKDEVNGLAGEIFTDSLATKQHFIQYADNYGIIHLATHASVNNELPLRSFITFYPAKNEDDYKLYAGEIYNLDLDSTQLIILSACETGAGKLVKGEGLMSLSRAFAYAGCPNIITSLWKAEDKATAFISKRLHTYLQKGFSKDVALQQAKLDLLSNTDIDPRFKSPNYWAHLIFIGQYESTHKSNTWWWLAGGILILTIVYLFFKRRKT